MAATGMDRIESVSVRFHALFHVLINIALVRTRFCSLCSLSFCEASSHFLLSALPATGQEKRERKEPNHLLLPVQLPSP
jgi:hypothetical protein